MRTKLGDKYSYGNAYGAIFDPTTSGDKFFDIWSLGIWHSFCLIANTKILEVYVDGNLAVSDSSYSGFLKQSEKNIQIQDVTNLINYEITDWNIWKETKTYYFIQDFASCQTSEEGNVLKWSSVDSKSILAINDYSQADNLCQNKFEILATDQKFDLENTVKFCQKLGGRVAVAKNEPSFNKMKQALEKFESCDEFYVGYSDKDKEGDWVDVNDKSPMMYENWADGEPDNFAAVDHDCAVFGPQSTKFKDRWCSTKNCPICEVQTSTKFQLIGKFQQRIDTHFVMRNMSFFMGYMFSKMFRTATGWEIRSTKDDELLAYWNFRDFPIGYISGRPWHETHNSEKINAYFYLKFEKPGKFFCLDGSVLDSSHVCDGKNDCGDGSDEGRATEHVGHDLSLCHGRIEKPSIYQAVDITVNASIYVLDVLDISQERSTFTLFFWLRLEWFHMYNFLFLSENYKENSVDKMTNLTIWKPNITFLHLYKKPLETFEDSHYVQRRASPSLHPNSVGGQPAFPPSDFYKGVENSFIKDSLHKAEFSCSFDNIRNYPFGKQNCSFSFFLIKTPAKLRPGNLHYQGSKDIGQYIIDDK